MCSRHGIYTMMIPGNKTTRDTSSNKAHGAYCDCVLLYLLVLVILQQHHIIVAVNVVCWRPIHYFPPFDPAILSLLHRNITADIMC